MAKIYLPPSKAELNALFGDGGASTAPFAPVDVVYSADAALSANLYCRNLTINSGVRLITWGFKIFCSGVADIRGFITCNHYYGTADTANNSVVTAAPAGVLDAVGYQGSETHFGSVTETMQCDMYQSISPTRPASAGAGATGTGSAAGNKGMLANHYRRLPGGLGGIGGRGGGGYNAAPTLSGAAGTMLTNTHVVRHQSYFDPFVMEWESEGNRLSGMYSATGGVGGSGGGGDGTNKGGGGGAGGYGSHGLCIYAKTLLLASSAIIRADGQPGGAGGNGNTAADTKATGGGGGGGGGGAGFVHIVTQVLTRDVAAIISSTGGAGGAYGLKSETGTGVGKGTDGSVGANGMDGEINLWVLSEGKRYTS